VQMMSDAKAVSRAPQESSVRLFRLPKQILSVLVWLFLALILSIFIEWIGMLFRFWELPGARHAESIFVAEWGYLHQSVADAFVNMSELGSAGAKLFDRVYYWVFTFTGIEWALKSLAAVDVIQEYIIAALLVTKTFVTRVTIVVLSMPIFILFMAWGFTEGLVRRDLRKFGVDYDKGMRYHYAKSYLFSVFIFPIVIYLANPFSLNPALIFAPFALATGMIIVTVMTNFNKYV